MKKPFSFRIDELDYDALAAISLLTGRSMADLACVGIRTDDGWPCPAAVGGDPPEADTCPHLVEEMARRIANVAAGNFWRMQRVEGGFVLHEHLNHEPTGKSTRFETS